MNLILDNLDYNSEADKLIVNGSIKISKDTYYELEKYVKEVTIWKD